MATRSWVVGANGTFSFNSPANWLYGVAPGPVDIAQFNTSDTDTVTGNATIGELLVTLGQINLTGSYAITRAQPTEISIAPDGANFAELVIQQGATVAGNEAVSVSGINSNLEISGTLIASSLSVIGENLYVNPGSTLDVAGPISLSNEAFLI